MGYEAKKTEHCGPKRGNGAYWGYKLEAKKESNRIRRENGKSEIHCRPSFGKTGRSGNATRRHDHLTAVARRASRSPTLPARRAPEAVAQGKDEEGVHPLRR